MDPALRALGEFGLIARIRAAVGPHAEGALRGIGDDAAVLAGGPGPLLATVDMLLEGVHFRREWGRPRDLGWKTLAVNVSDIAAMGGTPLFALLALGVPPAAIGLEEVEAVLGGLQEAAARFGVGLVGGDTCRSASGLVLSLTLLGRAPAAGAVLRSGGRPGDAVWLTGQVGGSAAGLLALERGLRPGAAWPATLPRPEWLGRGEELELRAALELHLRPRPRLAAGQALAGIATAMLDVSDGIASDAGHLSRESGVALRLEAARVPIHPAARVLGRLLARDPLELALQGGEDYELLFTGPADAGPRLAAAVPDLPVTRIGVAEAGEAGVRLRFADGREEPLQVGFDHFRS
jgi:thiamine-monophosphate kinase